MSRPAVSRYATTAGCFRTTSETASRSRPVAATTLWSADCETASAAFWTPSHSAMCLLTQFTDWMPMSAAATLRGSKVRSAMTSRSFRMYANSASPDVPARPRRSSSTVASVLAIRSGTTRGSPIRS
ncbi:hypothetical protein [Nonomuraea sp. NPDC050691]|uniref:hypothetical protein n=1 Tax=Nonomuraea sp. NPDC050691 TaxID=3155661 RepID=UPI0033D5EBAB